MKDVAEGLGVSKTAPVVVGGSVSAFTIFGHALPDIVQIITIIYLSFSIGKLLWEWSTEYKDRKDGKAKRGRS